MSGIYYKKIITNIIIIYFLITSSFIALISFDGIFKINNISASGIIIVDCNGHGNYTKIQDAIDNASTGDTIYVWEGVYYENIVINKTVSLIGNNSKNTKIIGNMDNPVMHIMINYVNISGFNISTNFSTGYYNYNLGILLSNTKNVTINNNNLYFNGIFLQQSNNSIIENNFVYLDYEEPLGESLNDLTIKKILKKRYNEISNWINLKNAHSNEIRNNIISKNNAAIEIIDSDFNIIENNSCISNNDGIVLDNANFNTFNKNKITINSRGFHVYCSNSNHFKDNNISNNYIGIELWKSHYNTIINNFYYYDKFGIWLRDSNSSIIKQNRMILCGLFIQGDHESHWDSNIRYCPN